MKRTQHIPQVVSIPNPLYKSTQGTYFVGQTKLLTFGRGSHAWGGLVNPRQSGVDLYVNVYTITNFSGQPFPAKVYLNARPPGHAITSTLVSPSNTTRITRPRAKLQYTKSTTGTPSGGTNVFLREVSPRTTLVSEEDGKFIIPPGGSFLLFLQGPSTYKVSARVALGWWEERRKFKQ